MQILGYNEFARLRLKDFYPESEIAFREGWEFMGGVWTGEGVGFTSFIRLNERPDQLGAIEIDLVDFDSSVCETILRKLQLPLRKGMFLSDVERALGTPEGTQSFTPDRTSYEFTTSGKSPYYISCTIQESDGLIFLTVIRKDILAMCQN
jgi:hypothetical protein